jgi:hypothetical protein
LPVGAVPVGDTGFGAVVGGFVGETEHPVWQMTMIVGVPVDTLFPVLVVNEASPTGAGVLPPPT